jgi:hypothetical protein
MQAAQVCQRKHLWVPCRRRRAELQNLKGGKGLPSETLSFPGYSMLEVSVGRRLRRQIPQSFL